MTYETNTSINVTFPKIGGYDIRYFEKEIAESNADKLTFPKVTATSHSVTAHCEIGDEGTSTLNLTMENGSKYTINYNKSK